MTMQANENGMPALCVANLLRTVRGEVPYQRMKGLDASYTDMPSSLLQPLIETDAEWLVEHYEPRAPLDSFSLTGELAKQGHFGIHANAATEE